jgi:hypothetical protein
VRRVRLGRCVCGGSGLAEIPAPGGNGTPFIGVGAGVGEHAAELSTDLGEACYRRPVVRGGGPTSITTRRAKYKGSNGHS